MADTHSGGHLYQSVVIYADTARFKETYQVIFQNVA